MEYIRLENERCISARVRTHPIKPPASYLPPTRMAGVSPPVLWFCSLIILSRIGLWMYDMVNAM